MWFFFGVLAGYLIKKHHKKLGSFVIAATVTFGFLCTLPAIAGLLATVTEVYPPVSPADIKYLKADAIVILAGGRDDGREEYGGVTVSKHTLMRLRYGAMLHRELNLPVLVTGGTVRGDGVGEAILMAEVLKKEFAITPTWVESKSKNTAQNAFFSAELLGARKVILVTNALHMLRAVKAFQRAGIDVVPAPMGSVGPGKKYVFSHHHFLPSEKALVVSHDALHEWVGNIWYSLRY